MTVIGLKSGKKSINWVSVGISETYFHRPKVHVEVISTTVADLSDLPLLSYRGKYGKNVKKKSKCGFYGPQKQF